MNKHGYAFGTAPVFLAAISTILGAILFLRFGYAIAHIGMGGVILLIILGHLITIPTALAIAEIATNLKVEGGGEYFIISRSFGLSIGGTIGLSLYLSQAISVAFYMIAFAQSSTPLYGFILEKTGVSLQTWMICIPATIILLLVIIKKGANIGVKLLWIVSIILGVSLIFFFMGKPANGETPPGLFDTIANNDDMFKVFAIIFPAFTGMTAGVGLSGDLKNPRKSIPLGTITATLTGMFVYIAVVIKLGTSMGLESLGTDQFAMSKVAIWGPIIPIGLAAATISSALGSILIAPRTLQAIAADGIFPFDKINKFLEKGIGKTNDPFNATFVTAIIVMFFVILGSVDFVAQVISMFFMITYGSLCLVSFLEHFSGNPSYRPTFKSKWYLSLLGFILCIFVMFKMSSIYALLSIAALAVVYKSITKKGNNLSIMINGTLSQVIRHSQMILQKQNVVNEKSVSWKPCVLAITAGNSKRLGMFNLVRWISHHYGFGTYVHAITGPFESARNAKSIETLSDLKRLSRESSAGIYLDTIVAPDFKTAIGLLLQLPGMSGNENNTILFEYVKEKTEGVATGIALSTTLDFNVCVYKPSERNFGFKKNIHIWLTPGDYKNANLMILLSYILMGHKNWDGSEIQLFVAFDEKTMEKEFTKLNDMIEKGRIPISQHNIQKVLWNNEDTKFYNLVNSSSKNADLIILGFSPEKALEDNLLYLSKFTQADTLFVRASSHIDLVD